MSWFEASTSADDREVATRSGQSRRFALRALIVTAAAIGLAACGNSGFRPLYGTLGADTGAKMQQVEFSTIPGRNGQRIRNELIFKAYGGGTGAPPRYRLDVAIKETVTTTLVLRDGTSAGQVYQIDARFQLVDITSKKVLLEGMSQSRASHERYANVFSNVRGSDDAQDRAARTIATDLNARISAFLSSVES